MSVAREVDVAILDDIECDLGIAAKKRKIAGKRSAKGCSKKQGTVVDRTGVPPETPTDSASTEATSPVDLLQLQSTVSVLAEQMSWFMDELREPEEIDTTTDLPLAIGDDSDEAQPLADLTSDTTPSVEQAADSLSALEKFYGVADTTGPDID